MQRGTEESLTVWQASKAQEINLLPLEQNQTADVCVVGAGIAGLTTAYMLQKEGRSVIVLDAYGVSAGETGRTTAHVTAVLDDRFYGLELLFGRNHARLAAESHMAAINRIEAIVKQERIDRDFERVDGLLVAFDARQQHMLDREREAARRAGFADMESHTHVPIPGVNETGPTLCFPRQATFHMTYYMNGLAKTFQRMGGRIFTHAHVNRVHGGKDAYVETDGGQRVNAQHIVIATHTPINDWVKMHTKQAAYRTYVMAYEISKDSYPGFLLWDLEEPYHYVRMLRNGVHDLLIVGGEDHKTGQANDMSERYRKIDLWAHRHFTQLGPVRYRWSGQIMEPVDSLAFIGRNPMDADNVYIVTGDSGNGVTHSTIAGILITDLIHGRDNPWTQLYDPSRKTVMAAGSYVSENSNVVGHMVKDWVKSSEVSSVDAIARGEGAILRRGVSKVAIYRDEEGVLHERSAICSHLGCVVQWNGSEKSWDCPCHGSRFDCEGRILNGPAIKPLAESGEEEQKAAS